MFLPFLATTSELESNVLATSKNVISAPKFGEAGSVSVTCPPPVLTKYVPPASTEVFDETVLYDLTPG